MSFLKELGDTSPRSSSALQLACHILRILSVISICLFTVACSRRFDDFPVYSPFPFKEYDNHGVGRFKTTYLVDQIDKYYRGVNPGPIGVTTFVNIDDLHSTSTFGRMFGEQLMSELSMRGYDVVELRHADSLQFMSDAGEFALSRDIASVRRARELGGVVVGTYVVSPLRVYVNARLIDPSSSVVLSAGSVEMSKTEEIARMLRGGSLPGTLERIPVKHLGYSTYPLGLFPQHTRVHELEDTAATPRLYEGPPAKRARPTVSN
jgi:TolB-like protein